MFVPGARIALCLLVASSVATRATSSVAAKRLDFNRDIRPILSDNCFNCHGPDEKKRKAKLRLDVRDDAIVLRKDHQAIKPKDIQGSELWRRINAKDDDQMPPSNTNKQLTAAQIE